MKRISYIFITLITFLILNISVFAASGTLSVSTSNVYVGDNFTVTVNVRSSAAWNIHVTSSGPVSNCSINQADATQDALDTNKTFTANCTATGVGTITIKLSGDVTSASDGNAVNVSGTKTVTVTNKPAQPQPNPQPSPNPAPKPNNNNNKPNNTLSKSTNNNLKEISVEGYELIKIDNNNYTLNVPNNINSINILATAEDAKATVTGVGEKTLQVGDNLFEIIIKSEAGTQNKVIIKVTKKDGYYISDLEEALKNDDVNIIITKNDKLTISDFEKIKNSGKVVKLNNNETHNSWIIDGSKIDNPKELILGITSAVNNNKISELSNYADGINLILDQKDGIASGVKIKLYVKDKYADGEEIRVYYYDESKNELVLEYDKAKVKDGYLEFDVTKGSNYFLTKSNINNNISINNAKCPSYTLPVALLLFSIIALAIVLAITIKRHKKLKKSYDALKIR